MNRIIVVVSFFVLMGMQVNAQSWLQRTSNLVKEKVKDRIDNKTEEAIDKGLDKTEDGVKKSAKRGKNTSGSSQKAESTEQTTSSEQAATDDSQIENSKSSKQKFVATTQYDFVPGDKVLYFEDFSQDAIGDFPALWTTNGGGEVKTLNIAPGNWFNMNKESSFYCYTKTIAFPQNFIMEFDFIPDDNFQGEIVLCLYEEKEKKEMNDDLYPGVKGLQIFMNEGSWGSKGYYNSEGNDSPWLEAHSTTNPPETDKVNHIIIWGQDRRLRIYHKGAKVLDSPTNIYAGAKFNRIRFDSYNSQCRPYITNLKVTTATPDTRSKLITEGKLVSYGIYFDVNKDVVKSESFGTLSDIAKTLKENPTVKIKIIGHTDSDGDDAKNLDLSKRRAASVKNALSTEFGIDGNRIQTDGKGESEPISANTSTEGKAKNRRVEFIKI